MFAPRISQLLLAGLVAVFAIMDVPAQTHFVQDDGRVVFPARTVSSPGSAALGVGCTTTFLTTHYNSNNGSGGNMFDMEPQLDLTIECLDVHVSSSVGSSVSVNLWYKTGSCVGFDMNQGAWTLLGTGTGTSAGMNQATNIDFSGNGVIFESDQPYGIFVDITSGSARYTDGGPTTFSNNDLSLTTYYGKSGWGNTYTFREWNGTLYYQPAGPSLAAPTLLADSYGTFYMEQLGEGSHAHFALSVVGLGTTPTIFGDLALAPPVFLVPPVPLVADAAGTVSLTITMPPNSLGRTVFVQGIELVDSIATMTDPISGIVQ